MSKLVAYKYEVIAYAEEDDPDWVAEILCKTLHDVLDTRNTHFSTKKSKGTDT